MLNSLLSFPPVSYVARFSRPKAHFSDQTQEPCDKAAIASVGCGETDYACHCAHSTQLQSIVVPCLQNSSTCTSSDLASVLPFSQFRASKFLPSFSSLLSMIADKRTSIRNPSKADLSESQRDWQRHLDDNIHIAESNWLRNHITVSQRGHAIAD
jgi:hypothetical protein